MEIYTKSLKGAGKADVLVVGSGSAGATAALAAAHKGASVILVERYGFMGGISTQVLDTFYGFYTPGSVAKKVVGGIPDLVVDELMKRGMAILRPNTYGAGHGQENLPARLWQRRGPGFHLYLVEVLALAERIGPT